MPGGSPPLPSTIITGRVRKVRGRNELRRMHIAHCAVKRRSASDCSIRRIKSNFGLRALLAAAATGPAWYRVQRCTVLTLQSTDRPAFELRPKTTHQQVLAFWRPKATSLLHAYSYTTSINHNSSAPSAERLGAGERHPRPVQGQWEAASSPQSTPRVASAQWAAAGRS